jgi:hypothetical protein
VDAVIPNHGSAAGETGVQIAGTGFTGTTGVAFGSTTLPPCEPSVFRPCFNLNGDRFIFANSPPGPPGTTVDITVTVGAVTSATNVSDRFSFDPVGAPIVSGVSPRTGSASGGTGVQIFGSGFTGATQVAFGAAHLPPCAPPGFGPTCFNVNGDNNIFTNSPPGTAGTTVDVAVSVGAVTSVIGQADHFTYIVPLAPIVDAVVPGHGSAAGGTGLQIVGSGLGGATQVAFGTTTLAPCPPAGFGPSCFTVNGDTGIFTGGPPGTAGTTVDVTVTASGHTSTTNTFARFTFDPVGPPVVSGVSPRVGTANGGTQVQILGSGFSGATSVAFGSTSLPPCAPSVFVPCFNVNGDVGIFTNSPAGIAGTMLDITVTAGGVTSAIGNADRFAYVAPGLPVVDAIVPGHGSAEGNTGVQIVGSGFSGATQVAFGTTTLVPCAPSVFVACFNVNGDNGIGTNSPPGTVGPVDVRVTTGAGTSAINAFDTFTYDPFGPPMVSGVSPRSGPAAGGTVVQILGSGFTGATAVAFGSATLPPCQKGVFVPCFSATGDGFILTPSPPGTDGTTVEVTVTAGGVTSPTGSTDKFMYTSSPPPTLVVDVVIPNHGSTAGGTNVQIQGSGFTGATAVAFGTTVLGPCAPSVFAPCFNLGGDNFIFANSPPGTEGPVDVTVTTGAGTSATNAFDTFTYDPPGRPIVSGVSPRTGPAAGGSGVQLFGSGFIGATAVTFGTGAPLPPCGPAVFGPCFNANGDNFMFANIPPGTPGTTVDITVTARGLTSAASNADRFSYALPGTPTVDAVVPGHGTAAGGGGVQILGSGFSGATQVAFGTTTLTPCTPPLFGNCFNVNGDNGIFTSIPAGTAGATVDVTVTVSGHTSATNAFDEFTFDQAGPPVVAGVSPHAGSANGATGVQILGSGFSGATAVAFGSTNLPLCSPPVFELCFNVNGDNGIFAHSPPGPLGTTVDVTVTAGGVTSATGSADKFTYVAPGLPVVDAVVPGHGTAAGGTNIQIHGSGFSGATSVAFGSTALPKCAPSVFGPCFNVSFDGGIFAIGPPASPGTVDVRVTTNAGISPINPFDAFTNDPIGLPIVSGVSPRVGPSTGGTGVQILGSGFTGATAVTFGASSPLPPCPAPGPCFHVNGDSGIFALSPPGTAGTTVDIRVTTPVGMSAISIADQFTYALPPVHTTLTETASLAHGGVPFTDTFTYRETNDGGDPIKAVSVTGSICGPAAFQSGDTNGNSVLDPGETWVFVCTHTFNVAGTYTDTATATGMDTTDNLAAPPETASATVQARAANAVLGPGSWKNNLSATGALLPVALGNFTVSSTAAASSIFESMNCGKSSPEGAVGCLAAELLSAELNVANDASNACVYATVIQANSLLIAIGYAGPGHTYTETAAQRDASISLAGKLDSFNNGSCA